MSCVYFCCSVSICDVSNGLIMQGCSMFCLIEPSIECIVLVLTKKPSLLYVLKVCWIYYFWWFLVSNFCFSCCVFTSSLFVCFIFQHFLLSNQLQCVESSIGKIWWESGSLTLKQYCTETMFSDFYTCLTFVAVSIFCINTLILLFKGYRHFIWYSLNVLCEFFCQEEYYHLFIVCFTL